MNNILITSAGRRVSLVRIFKKELNYYFPEAKLYTADVDPSLSAACYESDGAYKVMKNNEDGYVEELLNLALDLGVKLIVPTIDTGLQILADNKEIFAKKGIYVIVSSKELVEIFRDKRKSGDFFKSYGIDTPKIYDKNSLKFPLFIKPYDGSMSIDTFHIKEAHEITSHQLSNEKFMFMEYIDIDFNTEYTIDMYYDRKHILKCLVPRKRLEVRGGEVNKGITVKNHVFEYLKERLTYVEGAFGCLTMQVFFNSKTQSIKALEVNPRFGGGYPLSYLAGANYPGYLIRECLLNEDIEEYDSWEDSLLMLRYDDEILVHGSNI